jgi:uracil-DNA glycosylase
VSSPLLAPSYAAFRAALAASQCRICPHLCAGRRNIVVDRGNPHAKILIVGEAPGDNEDRDGRAFVGRAGKVLDKLCAAVGWNTEEDVLIVNVVKCRPPDNRPPTPEEAANCRPFLDWQIRTVNPRAVLLLGATAARHLLAVDKRPLRDRVGRRQESPYFPSIPFFLLYHPAFLLRDPRRVPESIAHLQAIQREILSLSPAP